MTCSTTARHGPVPSGSSVVTSNAIGLELFSETVGRYVGDKALTFGVNKPFPLDQVTLVADPPIEAFKRNSLPTHSVSGELTLNVAASFIVKFIELDSAPQAPEGSSVVRVKITVPSVKSVGLGV